MPRYELRRWNAKEIETLTQIKDIDELEKLLYRSRGAIWRKVHRLGLEVRAGGYLKARPEVVEQLNSLSDVELGWVAGIIDGEGTIGLYNGARTTSQIIHPRIAVVNTSKELINGFANLMGHPVESKIVPQNQKPCYVVQMERLADVISVLKKISPILVAKRKQAELAIEYCESRLKRVVMPTILRERKKSL